MQIIYKKTAAKIKFVFKVVLDKLKKNDQHKNKFLIIQQIGNKGNLAIISLILKYATKKNFSNFNPLTFQAEIQI